MIHCCKILPESDVACWSYANVQKGFVVLLYNVVLVMEIFCYRYSTISNSAEKWYVNLVIASAIYWGLNTRNCI